MSDITTAATYLAHCHADTIEAKGPKATAIAEARIEGACHILNDLGVGATPYSVREAVRSASRELGPRPAGGAYPIDHRAAWGVEAGELVARAIGELAVPRSAM